MMKRGGRGAMRLLLMLTDFGNANLAGTAILELWRRRIYKNHRLRAAEIFSQFGGELVPLENLNIRPQNSFCKLFSRTPSQAVISAQGISIGNDQHTALVG